MIQLTSFPLYIEIFAYIAALFFAIRKGIILVPVCLFFIKSIFNYRHIHGYDVSTYALLLPSYLVVARDIYKNGINIEKKLLWFIAAYLFSLLSISAIHYLMWNFFPLNIIKLYISSLWFLPFMFYSSKSDSIEVVIKWGAIFFLAATLLLLPQSFYFHLVTGGMGLGREISGLWVGHKVVNTWAIIPLSYLKQANILDDAVTDSLFSLKELTTYNYVVLSSFFFSILVQKFLAQPCRYLLAIASVLTLVYCNAFLSMIATIHIALLISTAAIFINARRERKKIIIACSLIALQILYPFIFNFALLGSLANAISSRINENKVVLTTSSDSSGQNELYNNNISTGKSRMERIKSASLYLIKNVPLEGVGDRLNNAGSVKNEYHRMLYSNHSFFVDMMLSLGLVVGFLFFISIFFIFPIWICFKFQKESRYLFTAIINICSVSMLLSVFGNYGKLASQLGFYLFILMVFMRSLMLNKSYIIYPVKIMKELFGKNKLNKLARI
jgi:hypothetical protein